MRQRVALCKPEHSCSHSLCAFNPPIKLRITDNLCVETHLFLARLGKRPDMENGLCDLAAGSNGITDCTCIAQFSAASIKKATLLSSSIGPLLCIESRH